MVTDSWAVINFPYDGDFKVIRQGGVEEIKPVEEAGNSSKPKLDIEKDKTKEKSPTPQRLETGDIYKNNGELSHEDESGGNNAVNPQKIDIII